MDFVEQNLEKNANAGYWKDTITHAVKKAARDMGSWLNLPGEGDEVGKKYVKWEFYENGTDESISGEKVNEIIEEIIGIMRKNGITVGAARKILGDTISSIVEKTKIT